MPKIRFRKKKKEKGEIAEKTFIAYIIKGNRQIIRRDIIASKRFRVDDNTYYVRDESIFYKNIDGRLQSVSYYRENNPNPYSFKGDNNGLTVDELDEFFAEDLFHIINNIDPENRSIYVFIMTIVNLIICALFMVTLLVQEFLL
jgi:hypothetical protein